jgi:hypothetical protein
MIAKGMSLNAAGFWITSAMPTDKLNILKGTEDDAQEN